MTSINLKEIKLVNWNANGIKSKKSSLMEFLIRHKIDIACITETHLKNTETFKINGYNIYRKDRDTIHSKGGVAILIKRTIKHHQLTNPELINIEAISIMVSTDKSEIKIISAYNPPNKKIQRDDINALFNENPTILLGDLNSKNEIWGCLKTNPNGNKLFQFTSELRIIISPPSKPTFHRTGRQPDILDIALVSNLTTQLYHQVANELDSDHVPVITTLYEQMELIPQTPKLINRPINWDIFRENLNKNLILNRSHQNNNEIDTNIQHLTESIKNAIKSALAPENPKKSKSRENSSLPLHIQHLIKEKHKARRIWQRTRTIEIKKRLNQLTRRVKWEIDNNRFNSYKTYLSKLNPNDASLWTATKRILKQRDTIPPLKVGLAKFETNIDKCKIFAQHFENCFTTEATTKDIILEINSPNIYSTETNTIQPCSPQEIKQIIDRLANKKSPGHDLITNKILKNLTPKALAFLASLLNSILRIGYFPNTWKQAIIIPIHKPGKPNSLPESYRPISLLPTLSKLLERIMLHRMKPYLKIIPHHQFGFKPHHSTCHQLQRISEIIVNGFENKKYTTTAFLDIAQAFDKVWHQGLMSKLTKLKMPTYLYNIITSFITNRTFKVRIDTDTSEEHPIKAGVPQGSVLGPTLFNIFCYDIPVPQKSQLAMYADDTVILTQHKNLENSITDLQISLDQISDWFTRWKLALNPTKSEAKIFSLKRYSNPTQLKIKNQPILWNNKDQSIKYLGVHLDEKLTWKMHINKKLNQAYTRLKILYPLINYSSTLQIKCSLLIYTSIIRPLITYACPIWAAASQTKIKKLQTIQNKFLRIALKAPWFMRNTQLHNDTGIPYINTWIIEQFKNFHMKLKTTVGALHFKIGKNTKNRRLKPRLPQDILLPPESSSSFSS